MTDPGALSGALPALPAVRSALFVPTNQKHFLDNIDRRGADAVILDLEDSVTDGGRSGARATVADWLRTRQLGVGPAIFVRINQIAAGQLDDDLRAIACPVLQGVLLPKIVSTREVTCLADALAWHEGRLGLELGTIRIWPLLETAEALSQMDAIACASPRIAYMGGATAPGGDLARAIGFEVSAEGLETLFLRSQALIAARAAGIHNPVTGMFTDIDDLDGFEQFARQSRRLGYEGIMVIHPSHVERANAIFTVDAAALAGAHSVIDALEAARLQGNGAIRHDGRMIDTAMAATARQLLAKADSRHAPTPQHADPAHAGHQAAGAHRAGPHDEG